MSVTKILPSRRFSYLWQKLQMERMGVEIELAIRLGVAKSDLKKNKACNEEAKKNRWQQHLECEESRRGK